MTATTTIQNSQSAHITDLARELLDDIELSRMAPEQLLLKASRLARLVDDDRTRQWLRFELDGYPGTAEARTEALRFGRIESADAVIGYWQPLAGISGIIASMQLQIQQLNVPNTQLSIASANPHEYVTGLGGRNVAGLSTPVTKILERLQALTTAVSTLTSIRSRVLNALHEFASRVFYERAFSGLAETIFDRQKGLVDELIGTHAADVIEKLPAIYDRLGSGDPESTSQALNSVRRMVKAFADAVYPPSEGTVEVDGQPYQIGTDQVLNRIKIYLSTRSSSRTRSERLNRTLRDIYGRATVGAHSDVSPEEARALFLHAYLTLGEILTAATELGAGAQDIVPEQTMPPVA